MFNRFLIFSAAAVLILAAIPAAAQTSGGDAPHKAAAAPLAQDATIIAPAVLADTSADKTVPPQTETALPDTESAAESDTGAQSENVPARLLITTDPPEAAVKIDGKDYGLSPVEAADLDTGSHIVELSKSGYFRRKATVQLDSSGAELHFELSRPSTLVVTSEPSGARIGIDGKDAGTSPVQNDKMRPGEYPVSAVLDGYKPFKTTVKTESGSVDTLHIVLEAEVAAAEQAQEQKQTPTQAAKADKAGKSWQANTILIAFFVFIAVLIGVEKSSY